MMLDQNENSEQLAVIKKKYGFDLPISQQYLNYLNDLSVISLHSKNTDNYTFFDENKYNGIKLLSLNNSDVVLKAPYLREKIKELEQIQNTALTGTTIEIMDYKITILKQLLEE